MAPRPEGKPETPPDDGARGLDRSRPPLRAAWKTPRLAVYGDLRQLTAGPSPGLNESGNPTLFKL